MVIRKMFCCIAAMVLLSIFCSLAQANPRPITWVCIDTLAPARSHFQCVFSNQGYVLFGGRDSLGNLPNDLWVWNGCHWSTLNYTGPCGRTDFGMCYDIIHRYILLFGGLDSTGNYLGDTWAFTDTGWVQLNIDGPSPRSCFAMACIRSIGHILLYGGKDSTTCFGDTWEFDGTQWSLRSTAGPGARIYSSMAYFNDSGTDALILFGGINPCEDTSYVDTWKWENNNWSRLDLLFLGAPRIGQVLNDYYGYMGLILYGGMNINDTTQFYSETFSYYNSFGWGQIDDNFPPPRAFGSILYDQWHECFYIISGANDSQTFHDVWRYPIFGDLYMLGDINGDTYINGQDALYFVNYLRGGPAPPVDMYSYCPLTPNPFYAAADVNGNCLANGIDITYLVRYLRGQVPNLLNCPYCWLGQ